MGFMDKFGTGEGWLAKNLGPDKDWKKKQEIKKKELDAENLARYEGNISEHGSGIFSNTNPGGAGGKLRTDASNVDTNDPRSVKRIQEALVSSGALSPTYIDKDGNEVSSIDGKFGPMTEKAYRGAISDQRSKFGADQYMYDDGQVNLTGEGDSGLPENKLNLLHEGYNNDQLEAINRGKTKLPTFLGEGVVNPDLKKIVDERVARNEELGVYSGDETGIGAALSDTMSDYKDLGSNVYDYFSNFWNSEEEK